MGAAGKQSALRGVLKELSDKRSIKEGRIPRSNTHRPEIPAKLDSTAVHSTPTNVVMTATVRRLASVSGHTILRERLRHTLAQRVVAHEKSLGVAIITAHSNFATRKAALTRNQGSSDATQLTLNSAA